MFSNLRLPIASVIVLAVAGCSAAGPTATPLASTQPTASAGATATLMGSPSPSLASTPTATAIASASVSPAPTASPSATTPEASPSASPPPPAAGVELVAGGGSEAPRNGIAATSALLARTTGVAVAPDGTVWVVDSNLSLIVHVLADGTLGDIATGLYGPEGVAVAPDGTVYIADRQNYRIATLDGSGGVKKVAGNLLRSGFAGDGGLASKALLWLPYDVATDASENVYIADSANQRIRMIDAATLKIHTIAGNGTLGFSGDGGPAVDAAIYGPQALAVDDGGSVLLIADTTNVRLRRVDLTTGVITTIAGNAGSAVNYSPLLTGLQTPLTRISALAMDAAGNAYFPVFYGDLGLNIMRLDQAGIMTRVAGGGQSTEMGSAPLDWALPDVLGLAINRANGDLYVCGSDGQVHVAPGVAITAGP